MHIEPEPSAARGLLSEAPPHWTSRALGGVRHAFFGREGGVSRGIYASLNAGPGSNDDPEAVNENRRRIAAALGCLAFGVFIEFAQWLDPPRDADPFDVLADAAGIALAGLLLRTPLARVLASGEAWLRRRHRD